MSYSVGGDPQGPHWEGYAWSEWRQLGDLRRADVPAGQGIYRLRSQGDPDLIYIGISDRLRSRLGGLRRARSRDDKRGHSAAACIAAHEVRGKTVDVSWVLAGDIDRRELLGREVDLIAAHRRLSGSPACQFHGDPDFLLRHRSTETRPQFRFSFLLAALAPTSLFKRPAHDLRTRSWALGARWA